MPPETAKPIPGFYMVFTFNPSFKLAAIVSAVAANGLTSKDIAKEIGKFLFDCAYDVRQIYDNAATTIMKDVYKLMDSDITQGYLLPDGIVNEYKTRIQIIDELLTEL